MVNKKPPETVLSLRQGATTIWEDLTVCWRPVISLGIDDIKHFYVVGRLTEVKE